MPGSLGGNRASRAAIVVIWLVTLAGGLLFASQSSDPLGGMSIWWASERGGASASIAVQGRTAEQALLIENEAAMDRMMAGMTITPTGDVDRDFVAVMSAHHQEAIDMAIAELRHGRNEPLRRIAQEIIVTRGQEIQAMLLTMRRARSASVPRVLTTRQGVTIAGSFANICRLVPTRADAVPVRKARSASPMFRSLLPSRLPGSAPLRM